MTYQNSKITMLVATTCCAFIKFLNSRNIQLRQMVWFYDYSHYALPAPKLPIKSERQNLVGHWKRAAIKPGLCITLLETGRWLSRVAKLTPNGFILCRLIFLLHSLKADLRLIMCQFFLMLVVPDELSGTSVTEI